MPHIKTVNFSRKFQLECKGKKFDSVDVNLTAELDPGENPITVLNWLDEQVKEWFRNYQA